MSSDSSAGAGADCSTLGFGALAARARVQVLRFLGFRVQGFGLRV